MNDEGRPAERPRHHRDHRPPRVPERPAPALVVQIELEGMPRVYMLAGSFEDEQRLLGWLRRSRALENARLALSLLLDQLDEIDEAA